MTTFTYPYLAPLDQFRTQISQTVCPSAISAYQPSFDDTLNSSHVPPTPSSASVASLPPSSPYPFSPFDNNSESDVGGDADYGPPDDDDDEEYHPSPAIPSKQSKKAKKVSQPKPPRPKSSFSSRRKRSSNTHASSPGSEASASSSRVTGRSRPSPRLNASRNIQRACGSKHIDKGVFCCPVCGHKQHNHRVPDFKRHIETHDRSINWVCRGVGMDVAHLYDVGISEDMSEEECVQAGAYVYRGQLMIGGCLQTFARRDALKRHVDNPNINCVGDMYSY